MYAMKNIHADLAKYIRGLLKKIRCKIALIRDLLQ